MTETLKPDVLILGGGIAGLWLINHLQQQGYSCLLLEKAALGGRQTLASQGIIHGGLKYALSGSLSGESEAIAAMPARWRAALAGDDNVNLTGLKLLAETQHLWSTRSLAGRMTAFFASKMLRGRIERLDRAHFPKALANPAFKGNAYRLEDLVVDTEALLDHLSAGVTGRLLAFDTARDHLEWQADGLAAATVAGVRIEPALTILAAGEGNAQLLEQARKQHLLSTEEVQLRPLKMVMVRHGFDLPFFGHCIGASNKPMLTITSHRLANGEWIWYLGGDIAEKGVTLTDAVQMQQGKKLLIELFPWLDWSKATFATLDINRAEPKQPGLVKPDSAQARRDRQLIVAWPTKLTLAPDLADKIRALLDPPTGSPLALPALPQAKRGLPRWQTCVWQTP